MDRIVKTQIGKMKNRTFTNGDYTFKRIDKREAEKKFNSGDILFVISEQHKNNPGLAAGFGLFRVILNTGNSWEYELENAKNNLGGRYLMFYIAI